MHKTELNLPALSGLRETSHDWRFLLTCSMLFGHAQPRRSVVSQYFRGNCRASDALHGRRRRGKISFVRIAKR